MHLLLALLLGAVPVASSVSAPAPSEESAGRALTPFEQSLIGAWFTSGDPEKRAYIASSGSKIFTINEFKDTLELIGGEGGAVVVTRPTYTTTGIVSGDFILWANGTWWSRHPVPPPPDDLAIWGDSGEGWTLLKTAGRPVLEEGKKMGWDYQWDRPMRIGGVLYRSDQCLSAHAPSHYKFTFDKPITEFRAVAGLIEGGHLGNVIFKARTDEGVVFTSEEIRHGRESARNVVLKFAPSKTLELIIDAGENDYEDWSVWVLPEVK